MKKLSMTITLLAASIANANCTITQVGEALKTKVKAELMAAAQHNYDEVARDRIQDELEFSDLRYDAKTSTFRIIAGYNPLELAEDNALPGSNDDNRLYIHRIEQQGSAPLAGVTYTVVGGSSGSACSYVFTTNQKEVRFLGSKTQPKNWMGLSSIIPFRVQALEKFNLVVNK